jgi:hypothetical protein
MVLSGDMQESGWEEQNAARRKEIKIRRGTTGSNGDKRGATGIKVTEIIA